ncbi:MAG: hypothetical protein OEW77_09330 [Gemmatimonadota bacterium]|nr:hypothetical protein [Gemmatimonadota bacterium]
MTSRYRSLRTGLPLLALFASPAAAQQKLPVLTPISPIRARSTEPMGAVSTVATLPGGRVLVNDILGRRVVLFDSTLTLVRVVADSTGATANAYGARGGGLLGFRGDSAMFIDPASLTMMSITAAGELGGVRAVPRANEIGFLVGGPNGRPGFDLQGRMVYRGVARGPRPAPDARPTVGNFVMPQQPDSAPVVRVDPATRKLDTLAMFKIPKIDISVSQGADGRINVQTKVHPMPTVDDWALLSDGSIAIVRGHDFHVDWVGTDKQVTSSPKIPFEWQRLSDEDKEMIVDSARTAMEKQRQEAQRMMDNAGGPVAFMGGGGPERMMVEFGGGGAPPPRAAPSAAPAAPADASGKDAPSSAGSKDVAAGASGKDTPPARGGQGPGGFQIPPINIVAPSELPDYRPPFGQQSALGDLDGHLWVRTSAPVGDAGPVYFVIDREHEVMARVQAPQGRIIVGFGKGGVVYLAYRDAEGHSFLESARWK